jgi:hypothetical protein
MFEKLEIKSISLRSVFRMENYRKRVAIVINYNIFYAEQI